MSDRVNHCPFLNRADPRCSGHFSLDRLGVAFDHCFGKYKACGSYQELLVERQARRGDAMVGPLGVAASLNIEADSVSPTLDDADHGEHRRGFAAFHLPVVDSFHASYAALAD